jgi:hypothetical protein
MVSPRSSVTTTNAAGVITSFRVTTGETSAGVRATVSAAGLNLRLTRTVLARLVRERFVDAGFEYLVARMLLLAPTIVNAPDAESRRFVLLIFAAALIIAKLAEVTARLLAACTNAAEPVYANAPGVSDTLRVAIMLEEIPDIAKAPGIKASRFDGLREAELPVIAKEAGTVGSAATMPALRPVTMNAPGDVASLRAAAVDAVDPAIANEPGAA